MNRKAEPQAPLPGLVSNRLLLPGQGLAGNGEGVEEGKAAHAAGDDYRREHNAHSSARGICVRSQDESIIEELCDPEEDSAH